MSEVPPSRGTRSAPPPRESSVLDAEALTLAMAVAPSAYSRNKMFSLLQEPQVARARSRASLIRSLARDLSRAKDACVASRLLANNRVALTIRIESMHYARNVDLSAAELSVLSFLCERQKTRALACTPEDRAVVERVLARLAAGLF